MNVAAPMAAEVVALGRSTCRAEIESRFQALAQSAEDAGWSADEVADALLSLAQANADARAASSIVMKLVERALAT